MLPRCRALCALLACIALCGARAAQAQTLPPTSDPGFAFVDVNGDLRYSEAAGDIALNPAVFADGAFDTKVSEWGLYRAAGSAASLVIPASVSIPAQPDDPDAGPVMLSLKASKDLVVHGRLRAGAIYLQSGGGTNRSDYGQATREARCTTTVRGNVDLTDADCRFDTTLVVSSGQDVTLDGTTITATDWESGLLPAVSKLAVFAPGSITAGTSAFSGNALSAVVGQSILMNASGSLQADGAWLATSFDPAAEIQMTAREELALMNWTSLLSGGAITLKSSCGSVLADSSALYASSVALTADGDASVLSTAVTGVSVSLQACSRLCLWSPDQGFATSVSASKLTLKGSEGVDAAETVLTVTPLERTPDLPGTLTISSGCGPVCLDRAYLQATGGVTATSRVALSAQNAEIQADRYLKLTSTCDGINADGSKLSSFSAPGTISFDPATFIQVQAACAITANPTPEKGAAVLAAPAKVIVKSLYSNVYAEAAQFLTPLAQITAYGGYMDVIGAYFDGAKSFRPNWVTVAGP